MEFNYDVLTSCKIHITVTRVQGSGDERFGMKLMDAKLAEYVTAGISALVM